MAWNGHARAYAGLYLTTSVAWRLTCISMAMGDPRLSTLLNLMSRKDFLLFQISWFIDKRLPWPCVRGNNPSLSDTMTREHGAEWVGGSKGTGCRLCVSLSGHSWMVSVRCMDFPFGRLRDAFGSSLAPSWRFFSRTIQLSVWLLDPARGGGYKPSPPSKYYGELLHKRTQDLLSKFDIQGTFAIRPWLQDQNPGVSTSKPSCAKSKIFLGSTTLAASRNWSLLLHLGLRFVLPSIQWYKLNVF